MKKLRVYIEEHAPCGRAQFDGGYEVQILSEKVGVVLLNSRTFDTLAEAEALQKQLLSGLVIVKDNNE